MTATQILEVAIICLGFNVYHEARGEPISGKFAVALTTLNRAKHEPARVCAIVKAQSQFSWTIKPTEAREREALEESMEIARLAFGMADFTGGATHYHEIKIVPWWIKTNRYLLLGRWGNHLFYKEK